MMAATPMVQKMNPNTIPTIAPDVIFEEDSAASTFCCEPLVVVVPVCCVFGVDVVTKDEVALKYADENSLDVVN